MQATRDERDVSDRVRRRPPADVERGWMGSEQYYSCTHDDTRYLGTPSASSPLPVVGLGLGLVAVRVAVAVAN